MKLTIRRSVYFSYALLAGAFLNSCSNDSEPADNQLNEVQIEFSLASINPESRAGGNWGDTYTSSASTDAENAIQTAKIFGYIYLEDGTLVGNIKDVQLNGSVYTAKVNSNFFTTQVKSHNLTMHVFANTGKPLNSDSPQRAALKGVTATRALNATNLAAVPNPMPMWGVATCKAEYTVGTLGVLKADFGDVKMLRSFAKVEVEVKNDIDANDTFNSLRLNGPLTNTYYLIPNYADEAVTKTASVSRYADSFSNPGSTTTQNITLNAKEQKVVFYITEHANPADNEIKMYLTVNGDEINTPVLFRNYKDGAPAATTNNIMRNHNYKFTVRIDKGSISVVSDNWEDLKDNTFDQF